MPTYSVVDIFAGPGGLAEGFSSVSGSDGTRAFDIALSIEKDFAAHSTLRLRAFLRQFAEGLPDRYYEFLNGGGGEPDWATEFPREWDAAVAEAWQLELGKENPDLRLNPRLDQIRESSGGNVVLIGGPPCQAYSLVGRARNQGKEGYIASEDHRHFLYEEYIRILDRLRPAAFVMENVKGMLSSSVDGENRIFDQVLKDLGGEERGGGRYRLIALAPGERRQLDFSRGPDTEDEWRQIVSAALAFVADVDTGLADEQHLAFTVAVARHHDAFRASKRFPRREGRGKGISSDCPAYLAGWLTDARLKTLPNHQARSHMASDLARYFFAAVFAEVTGRSPKASDFPDELAPEHQNWSSGKFADRFRVQVATGPSTTVTSHISKDGHYFIHPDPQQCRSLSVREAARLQTFPDNYFFKGNRTQQYVQVGNAVPPLLARWIGEALATILSTSSAPAEKARLSHVA